MYLAPNINLIDSVHPDQAVTVLGRTYQGNWLYVQTASGKRGFAYRPYFDWTGDFQALKPIPVPITPTATPTTRPTAIATIPSSDFIGLDFYTVGKVVCKPKPGYHLYLRGLGELYPFKYYVDGQLVYQGTDQYVYDYTYPEGMNLVKVVARAEARDGRSVEASLALRLPTCH